MNLPIARRRFLRGMAACGGGAALLGAVSPFEGAIGAEASNAQDQDWAMLKGNARHTGFRPGRIPPGFSLAWAIEIAQERLGTAIEPIVAGGKLFVPTHRGNLYALDAESGKALWKFQTEGALLHSPAVTGKEAVLTGSTGGRFYAVSPEAGKLIWQLETGPGGYSAAPVIEGDVAYLGTRAGDFLAIDLHGRLVWKHTVGSPIRQTAAVDGERVFVTGEDLVVRCFSKASGELIWRSRVLSGQTARDYYPVVVKTSAGAFVVVRTNPLLNMGQRIGRDRTLLCRNAGVDDSSWQKLDAWIKSESALGTPELWAKEQQAIREYLGREPDAQTFFVFDAETGKEASAPPVLWIAGCQGVGAMPAQTSDGRLLVFYRSAYGNWNHGVAPLVALGLLDLAANQITPLFHRQGAQPRWNCFWGTADESQNFVVIGETVLIVHQGTLSGFDLGRNELFPIWGERDTYGGFRNPAWARNEWHGPGRSGVAVVGSRIYWQTGSRILCLVCGVSGEGQKGAQSKAVSTSMVSPSAPVQPGRTGTELERELAKTVEAVLDRRWAPLFTDPGLAGRVFAFQHSAESFEALAWAYPHLEPGLQSKVQAWLQAEWEERPPFSPKGAYPLEEGTRREWCPVEPQYCKRLGGDHQPHVFGYVYAAYLYGERCQEFERLRACWPQLKAAWEDFRGTGWRLNAARGDLFANRYLSSLMAMRTLAEKWNDLRTAEQLNSEVELTCASLLEWWTRAATQGTLRTFNKASELDPFIGRGDGLFFAEAPHRHRLALFQDLTPEIGSLLRQKAGVAARQVWETFESLCPTWHLAGEERQVHFGENFLDPPDFALSAFRALTWLEEASHSRLSARLDLPFCRADLNHVMRLAWVLQASER